jgi:hypothetical protein
MRSSRGRPDRGTAASGICPEGVGMPRTATQSTIHVPSERAELLAAHAATIMISGST